MGETDQSILSQTEQECGGLRWPADRWQSVWAALTPPQRAVVELLIVEGLTMDAAASRLGRPLKTVAGVWRRAVLRLRRALPPR